MKIKYYHAVNEHVPITFSKFEKILQEGAILSRKNQRDPLLYNYWYDIGYNGDDFISVCRHYDKINGDSYKTFVMKNLSFELDLSDLNIYETEKAIVPYERLSKRDVNGLTRYSDMDDEIQIKDKILLSRVKSLTFPTEEFFKNMDYKETRKERLTNIKRYIEKIKLLMNRYDYDFKLYDIDTDLNIESDEYNKYILSFK